MIFTHLDDVSKDVFIFDTRMSELFRVIVGRKERTAKVYTATIRRIYREIYKKELEDKTFK